MEPEHPGVVHFVLPHNVDEPSQPSGGNYYDRRLCEELVAAGWLVHEHTVAGSWPWADDEDVRKLARSVAAIPDCSTVLVDGLIASNAPDVFVPATERLHLVVLLHTSFVDMPSQADVTAAHRRERAVLSAARRVVTTSRWSHHRLLDRYGLRADLVTVATPGVDERGLSKCSSNGGRLLCVAAVAPHKGHHILIDALGDLADQEWSCRFVGALDPHYAAHVRDRAAAAGIGTRIEFCGPLSRENVDDSYRSSDLLLHASRYETYGMVVTEAIAHGVPVVAAGVGGLREAMGLAPNGGRPGMLVAPGDGRAFALAIRAWLEDADLRTALRAAAKDRRNTLLPWSTTAGQVAYALGAATDGLEVPA